MFSLKNKAKWIILFLVLINLRAFAAETPTRVNHSALPLDNAWHSYSLAENTYAYCPFKLSSNGRLALKIQTYFDAYHYVALFDQNLEQIDRVSVYGAGSADPKTTEFQYHLRAGTYYARIESWNAASGLFRLMAAFQSAQTNEAEPNDSFAQATQIPIDSTSRHAFLSSKCTDAFWSDPIPSQSQDHVDYFKFSVRNGKWDIRVNPLEEGGSFVVTLYGSNYSKIWTEYITGEALSKTTELPSGICYLKVEPNGSKAGIYAAAVLSYNCPHTWSGWSVTKKATVFHTGNKKRTCSLCGAVQAKAIPKAKAVVKLNSSKLSLRKGVTSKKIKVKKYGNGDYIKRLTVKNTRIAKARKNGKFGIAITGKKVGKTKVTVKMASGKKTILTVIVKK